MPELMHNLNLLVDVTEEKIRRNDSQLKSTKVCFICDLFVLYNLVGIKVTLALLKDRTTALGYDLEQAKLILETDEKEFKRINEVLELIET